MKINKLALVSALLMGTCPSYAGFVDNRATDAVIEVNYKSIAVEDLIADIVPGEYLTEYAKPEQRKTQVRISGKGTWYKLLTDAVTGSNLLIFVDQRTHRIKFSDRIVPAERSAEVKAALEVAGITVVVRPASPIIEVNPVWTLTAGHTVGQELQAWGKKAGWKVVWNMSKDWSVPASTSFPGDFKAAATSVIQTLAANGALVRAQFFDGNKTIVVTGPGVAAQ